MHYRLTIFSLIIFLSLQFCTNRDPKFQQYFAQGEQLYEKHCSNCHQKTGAGLGRLYPPLAASDYLKNNSESIVCLMKYGLKGEVVVNSVSYNKTMPGVISLTDLEIAEIATYINNSWGNKKGLVDVQQVSAQLKNCSPR
jgi:mono/diheme cytochrome c family protein